MKIFAIITLLKIQVDCMLIFKVAEVSALTHLRGIKIHTSINKTIIFIFRAVGWYFSFLFIFKSGPFKKGCCQLQAKVCARSTG